MTGERSSRGYFFIQYLSTDPYSREDQANFAKWYADLFGIIILRFLISIQ